MKTDTAKLPYFKFMVDKWLAGDIQALDLQTQAIFINLVAMMWRDGGVYSKPIGVLVVRCGCGEETVLESIDMLKDLGIIYVDEDGFLRVKFVDEQLSELIQAHEQKVLAGKKGAESRYGKQNHSSAIAPPKHIDKDTDKDNKKCFSESFERCWKAYPSKTGSKHIALKAYKKANPAEADVMAGIERYKAYVEQERNRGFKDLKYANGQTWFNQRRWESEYEVEGGKSQEELDLIKRRMNI